MSLMTLEPPVPAAWNFQIDLRLNARALSFTVLLTFITALLFGLAPALQASKPDLVPALKDDVCKSIQIHAYNPPTIHSRAIA
jgi:hypothetical protein